MYDSSAGNWQGIPTRASMHPQLVLGWLRRGAVALICGALLAACSTTPTQPSVTPSQAHTLAAEAARVRADKLFAAGQPVEAVRTLVERGTWLNTSDAIIANQRLIWNGLASAKVPTSAASTGNTIIDGWLALAPIAAAHLEGSDLRQALLEWRRRFTSHPASGGLLAEILRTQRGQRNAPAQVALLLPLSSPQRAAAIAIRDGFLAEHFREADDQDTRIKVYDATALGAKQAYERAQLEGADFIVGPLLRPAAEEVVPVAGLVPTMTLNFVKDAAQFPNALFQFALAPEDEAREVARQAVAAGRRTALVIYPSTEWGYRVFNTFRGEFNALGGEVLGVSGYAPTTQDFSARIESLLNLDRSKDRQRKLAAVLDVSLQFEPRRRHDVDMIFIGTDRITGLLLAPALRFHFAGDIPTYATSEIFDPGATTSDEDLDGIYFPDAPWLLAPDAVASGLHRAIESYWPQRAKSDLRLYGMGIDAYRLMLDLYNGATQWPLEGVTGKLTMDAQGRIHRSMPMARFENGTPVPVEVSPVVPSLTESR